MYVFHTLPLHIHRDGEERSESSLSFKRRVRIHTEDVDTPYPYHHHKQEDEKKERKEENGFLLQKREERKNLSLHLRTYTDEYRRNQTSIEIPR